MPRRGYFPNTITDFHHTKITTRCQVSMQLPVNTAQLTAQVPFSEPAANLADCGPECGPDRDFAVFEQGPFWPKSLF
jgi:hypothetical protein